MLLNKFDGDPRASDRGAISRREVLVGVATTALVAGVPALSSAARRLPSESSPPQTISSIPVRRYMSAAVAMMDGTILVTGGYDRPWSADLPPMALSSAVIYDPRLDEWRIAAEMSVPRARHAATLLSDGRIVVAGGMSRNPTSSVEVYDPESDSWDFEEPLSQPRYDHALVASGNSLLVLGGSSLSIMSGVEQLIIGNALKSGRNP